MFFVADLFFAHAMLVLLPARRKGFLRLAVLLLLFLRLPMVLLLLLVVVGSDNGGRGERRVLTFPSGVFSLGRRVMDLDLLLNGLGDGLRRGLGLAVLVGGRKDAEGNGDASLKVQVGRLWRGAKRSLFFLSVTFRYVLTKGKAKEE